MQRQNKRWVPAREYLDGLLALSHAINSMRHLHDR
jgi:hypothetical protein